MSVLPFALYDFVRMWVTHILTLLHLLTVVNSVPPEYPASGNGLWFNSSGIVWSRDWLPIGNGYLAGEFRPGSTVVCKELTLDL
jgi:alpha-L-fucosidase 2